MCWQETQAGRSAGGSQLFCTHSYYQLAEST